jgi:hypothetical protein
LLIKLVWPLLSKFNTDEYVKMWLLGGRRHAEETACRKKEEDEEEDDENNSLWDTLQIIKVSLPVVIQKYIS